MRGGDNHDIARLGKLNMLNKLLAVHSHLNYDTSKYNVGLLRDEIKKQVPMEDLKQFLLGEKEALDLVVLERPELKDHYASLIQQKTEEIRNLRP